MVAPEKQSADHFAPVMGSRRGLGAFLHSSDKTPRERAGELYLKLGPDFPILDEQGAEQECKLVCHRENIATRDFPSKTYLYFWLDQKLWIGHFYAPAIKGYNVQRVSDEDLGEVLERLDSAIRTWIPFPSMSPEQEIKELSISTDEIMLALDRAELS